MVHTGRPKLRPRGTRIGSGTLSACPLHESMRLVCMGTLSAAENGLVIVSEASSGGPSDRSWPIPSRYQLSPMGRTKRTSRARYVMTIDVDVFRASAEHISPTD